MTRDVSSKSGAPEEPTDELPTSYCDANARVRMTQVCMRAQHSADTALEAASLLKMRRQPGSLYSTLERQSLGPVEANGAAAT
eukprot:1370769-Pleurochrysis_carterae.AAC.1